MARRFSARHALAGAVLVGITLTGLPDAKGSGAPTRTASDVASLVTVDTPDRAARQRVADLGLDLTEHAGHDYVEVVLHGPEDAAKLAEAGFTWDVRIPDLAERERERARLDAAFAAANPTTALPSGRNEYRTMEDYNADMEALAKARPDLVRMFELPNKTVEGRPVYGLEIAKNPGQRDPRPGFAIMGVHHAREWPSGELTMELAIDLVKSYGKDPRVTRLVDGLRTFVVPIVNVDGFIASRTAGAMFDGREVTANESNVYTVGTLAPWNAYRRRNCRLVDGQSAPPGLCGVGPATRFVGVDPNRNYGAQWGGAGASAFPVDDTYRGAGPFSEPETQNIRHLVSRHQITVLITNHTFSNLVLRPPGVRDHGVQMQDELAMRDLGLRMTLANGYANQRGYQLYDTSGTTEDWSYNATAGYGYTFEIGGDEFHPPFEDVVHEYLGQPKTPFAGKGNREAYLLAMETALDPAHHARIVGTAPKGATLRLSKTFDTSTSAIRSGEGWLVSLPTPDSEPATFKDTLQTVLTAPGGRFEWHVNPSTRPAVQERRVINPADKPKRSESTEVTVPTGHVDVPFVLTKEDQAEILQIDLDWPTPDDYDLEVYYDYGGGYLKQVGSSGNFVGEKEQVTLEVPDPGRYVLRVINFASASPTATVTASVFARGKDTVIPAKAASEAWVLTCELPGGRRTQRAVTVGRGGVVDVGNACA